MNDVNDKIKEDLEWIVHICQTNHDSDKKLRTRGARTLRRIIKRAEESLERL